MICSTDAAKETRRSVAVSLESLSVAEIDPRQELSVVLRVKNDGQLPVVLPISLDSALLQPERDAVQYHVELPIKAGGSGQTVASLGWLELYGSSSKWGTTVNLRPREWITVRGHFKPHRWFPGQLATAYSDLQPMNYGHRVPLAYPQTNVCDRE